MRNDDAGSSEGLLQKALMVLVIISALPFIIPLELYYRALYPEARWTKYAAGYEVYRYRRGLPTHVEFGGEESG